MYRRYHINPHPPPPLHTPHLRVIFGSTWKAGGGRWCMCVNVVVVAQKCFHTGSWLKHLPGAGNFPFLEGVGFSEREWVWYDISCNIKLTTYYSQYTTHNIQHTTHNIQHTAYNMRNTTTHHTTHYTQHTNNTQHTKQQNERSTTHNPQHTQTTPHTTQNTKYKTHNKQVTAPNSLT